MTKERLIAGVLVISLVVISLFGLLSDQYAYAEQKKTVEEYVNLAGEYIKNNPELLSKSINAVGNQNIEFIDIVTDIDLVPLTIGELEFRKGLTELFVSGEVNENSIFNKLIEEKIIISYAIRNNILPTRSEIDNFINEEKLLYEQEAELKKIIDDFCIAANMSFEDYWNTYEYYNAFRIVTFKKAYDFSINVARIEGKVKEITSDSIELNNTIQ